MKKSFKYPNQIKKYREALGFSVKELVRFLGLKSEKTLHNWEARITATCYRMYLLKHLVVLNVKTDTIYKYSYKKN